ncbi:MAG: hypothetical protein ACOZQL_36110 [Myxococcota bacterium]
MKPLLVALVVLGVGCGEGAVPAVDESTPREEVPAVSARNRLEAEPQLFRILPVGSEGVFTTRRVQYGTERAPVHFAFDDGWIEAQAGWDRAGTVLGLTRLSASLPEFRFSASQLPPNGLTFARAKILLAEPTALRVQWMGDNELGLARGTVPVELHLWLRLSNGNESPLEVAHLELPVTLVVHQASGVMGIDLEASQAGALWDWAELFELGDLRVQVRAAEKSEHFAPMSVLLN